MKRFFSFDGKYFNRHDTLEQARAAAEGALDMCRDEAPDGWPEETGDICYGEITAAASVISRRPIRPDEPMYGEADECIEYAIKDLVFGSAIESEA